MTACPWLNEHGFTLDGACAFLDEHVMPYATRAAEATEDAMDQLRAEVQAEPRKALVIAAVAGLALGLALSARRR